MFLVEQTVDLNHLGMFGVESRIDIGSGNLHASERLCLLLNRGHGIDCTIAHSLALSPILVYAPIVLYILIKLVTDLPEQTVVPGLRGSTF
jgi:hypothetical protein